MNYDEHTSGEVHSLGEAPGLSREFDSLEDLFDRKRWSDDGDLATHYEQMIDGELDR